MARRHRVYRQIEGKKRYEHRSKTLVSAAMLVIILAFPLSVYKVRAPLVISAPSAMDVAQVARNLARGGGFTTNIIQPRLYRALPRFTKPPDITNPPLHVWLLARLPGMRKANVLASPDSTVANFSSFFYLATALLLYLFESRMGGTKVTALASLICLFTLPLLRAAVSGTGESLSAAMITLLLVMVYADRNQSILYSFLLGTVAGLCYLTSYVYLALLAPLIGQKVARGGEGLVRHLVALVAGTAVVAAPWMIRNLHFGGNALWAQPCATVLLGSPAAADASTLWGKLYLQFTDLYASIIRDYGGVFALVFFIVSPLVQSERENVQRAKAFLWKGLAAVCVCLLLGQADSRAVIAFLPGAILIGCRTFSDIITRGGGDSAAARNRSVTLATGVFIALNLLPFATAMWASPSASAQYVRDSRLRSMADMRGLMHAGEILMTNAQEWMAYYGEFNTLPIPQSNGELTRWNNEFGQLRFAAVCPYGVQGPVETIILKRREVPAWFIGEQAQVYPSGELFFAAAEAKNSTDDLR